MGRISKTHPIPKDMQNIITTHTASLGVVGVGGGLLGPGADLPVIASSWVGMTVQLADEAGHHMKKDTVKKICLAVATGAGSFLAGSKIASTVFGWVTAAFTAGASLVVSAAGNAALNASFTRAYGRACAKYFLQVEEFDNFEVMVQVLVALLGNEMGIDMGGSELIA